MRRTLITLSVVTLAAWAVLAQTGGGVRTGGKPAAAAAPEAVPPPLAPRGPLRIGINLAALSSSSDEAPFLDRAKLGGWGDAGFPTPATHQGVKQEQSSVPLEAGRDYIMTYTGAPVMNYWNLPDDAARARHNVISWNGTMADVQLKPGRITFRASGNSVNWAIWSLDPANPMRDVHIVRKDQEALFRAGEIINPEFTAAIGRHFSPHRYMDWGLTNGSILSRWADRPKLTDASWRAAPIEAMVADANASGADMWMSIPHLADDDYVRQATTLVRDTLNPRLKLHLELSNEVWNGQFAQSKWAEEQGKARLGANVAYPTQAYFGYRSAQVMRIAHDVFAAQPGRLIGVYAAFTGFTDPALDAAIDLGVARANVGTIRQLFGEYAVTTYFGGQLSGVPTAESDANRVVYLAWARANDLTSAFREIEHGGSLKSDDSLDRARQLYAFHGAEARKRGLPMVAYEGGLAAYWFGLSGPDQAVMMPFVQRMLDDPRMGQVYTRMAQDFAAAGGALLVHYNDVGGLSIWGPWPLTPNLKTSTPRLEALKALSARSGTATAAGQ